MVQIALVSCGTEYSGIQKEIEKAALKFGAEIILPEIDLDYINEAYEKFGFSAQSSSLKLMIARAMSIVEGRCKPDAVFIATCFRCAEGALVRNEVRRFIQNNTRIPVVTYSFTERTKADELFIRMEALATTVTRRSILAREKQEGLTLGLDSGSTTTKAVLMENNKVIGTGWTSTKDIIESAKTAKAFGIEPKVAMLSFSTKGSAVSDETLKVSKAVEIANELDPSIVLDGEFQFDAAFVPSVAKQKAPNSVIQGDANVFIFPSLEAGNIGYKIAQRLGNFQAIGPILQGLNAPVNDLSRGCSSDDVYKLSIITAAQCL